MKNINRFASSNILKIAMEILGEGNPGTIRNIVDTLTASSEYEYIITDGGKPEGEGWEKSPYSNNPNSWRREKGKYHDSKGKSELRSELQGITYDDVPEDAKKIMKKLIGAAKLGEVELNAYTRDMMRDKSIFRAISGDMDYDYLESDEAKLVNDFGDEGYEKDCYTRRELSNLICQIMNVPPDNYSIDETWDVDEETLENAEKFIQANQKAAYMSGLVDEDGYILAYRGTDGQIDSNGKYLGANCESWAIDPSRAFPGDNFIKAKIPISRVIGCSLGNDGLYPCDESEITVCTAGLDFDFEDLNPEDDNELQRIQRDECVNAAQKIKENLLRLQNQKKEDKKEVEDNRTPEQKKLDDYLQKSKKDKVSIAKDSETPSDILDILAESQIHEIRSNVAKNSSTSAKTLEKLSNDPDEMIRQIVAENQNASGDVLRKLSQDEDDYVREEVSSNRNTPPDVLESLSKEENYVIRENVAKNPNTPKDALRTLGKDNGFEIKLNVAGNPNSPSDILDDLSKDYIVEVRGKVAKNISTPENVLDNLAKDGNVFIRQFVANNPNTSDDTLETLAKDKDQLVSSVARKVLEGKNKPTVQELPEKAPKSSKLSSDFSKKTPKKLELPKPPKSSSELKQMADKGDDVAKLWLEERKKLRYDFCVENIGDEETYQQMKSYKKAIREKHGYERSPQQVKDDFIKNMNSSKYGSPEEFQAARKRIQDIPVGKFDKLLGIIFNEEEETEKK